MPLNHYSIGFLAALLDAFPELSDRVVEGPEDGCFSLDFKSPAGELIRVFTDEGDRITVGGGASHRHFGGWAESVDAQDYDAAIGFIRQQIDR